MNEFNVHSFLTSTAINCVQMSEAIEEIRRFENAVGTLAVRHTVAWVKRNYVLTSLWLLGLLVGVCFKGFSENPTGAAAALGLMDACD